MKKLLLSITLVLASFGAARAQLGGLGSFGDSPIEITSETTRVENGIAIAEQNVIIRYGETEIYCDYAQYHPDTRDVFLSGNVRLYREGRLFTAERALYNLETKIFSTSDFQGEALPFRFGGDSLSTLGSNAYLVKNGVFTTSDSSEPDYHLQAKTVRIYSKDRVIFSNVRVYIGRVPVFYYPYLYQSLNQDSSFRIFPAYQTIWGATLLSETTFPINDQIAGKWRSDLYADRGMGSGFEARWGGAKYSTGTFVTKKPRKDADPDSADDSNWGRFLTYYIRDSAPGTNKTALGREPISPDRYRVTLQDRTYFTEDIYSTININKLSDPRFLQDFDQKEFRRNPNPDNVIALTKWNEDYSINLLYRQQINDNFDGTERLPELSLDIKRQPLFKTPFFYDSDSSAGFLRRIFATNTSFDNYESFRADTYHQISYPGTYFGFLSVVPKVGLRGTYYNNSGFYEDDPNSSTLNGSTLNTSTANSAQQFLNRGGPLFRTAVTAGVETSFKLSKAFEGVQSRAWGLDGLRHVFQPYINASFVYSDKNPKNILQFDRINRSTQLPPIDFPQFNTIDSLGNWSILRLGMRNRLQTRRDNDTLNWFELDTFVDINIDRPDFGGLAVAADTGTFSNFFNRFRWIPLPWVALVVDSQIPLLDTGFTEINSNLNFLVNKNLSLAIGERYIDGNNQFPNSTLFTFGTYYRINDHWSVSANEQYDFITSTFENQVYQIHRDLSSWVASAGFSVRDNGGTNDISVLITFTLKDLPNLRVPFTVDPGIGNGLTGTAQ